MAAIYSNGGNRWNILGFNFTKRDALPSVYKISMGRPDEFRNQPRSQALTSCGGKIPVGAGHVIC